MGRILAHDFFDMLITEMNYIITEGEVSVKDRRLPWNIRCFNADALAFTIVLNHYDHNSSHACAKCMAEDHWREVLGYRGSMVFLGIRHRLRTQIL